MIDLSHLTEEEQGMIMTVLKRDAELKKAEEERIGKLSVGSRSETKLKYLTGEWFYEAKSRRHKDKIHGSEIILASMKPSRASNSDGSVRLERPRATSGRGSDIVAPPKPARHMETTQPQEKSDTDAEIEKLNVAVRSPPRPRHNPFNRASLILVEAPEMAINLLTNGNQEHLKPSETEPINPLKYHTAGHASQTSGGSITSEGPSVGFKPVPKKRTFLSRRTSDQSGSDSSGLCPQAGSKVVVPAPRGSLRLGSSGGSNQSSMGGMVEQSQNTTTTMTSQASPSGQPFNTPNQVSPQQLCYASLVTPNNRQERSRNLPSITRERVVENTSDNSYHTSSFKASSSPDGSDTERNSRMTTNTKNERPADRAIPGSERSEGRDGLVQREYAGMHTTSLSITGSQDPEKTWTCNVGTAIRQEDLSLTQSIVDPPVRYNLNFTDKPEQHTPKKSRQKLSSKSSLKTPSPNGEEDNSIAKVLEWFSRSTDSNDWLDTEHNQQDTINSDRQGDETVITNVTGDNYEIRMRAREREAPEMKRDHLQREAKEAKNDMEHIKLRATDRKDKKEVQEMREEVRKGTREQVKARKVNGNEDESQPLKISHLKSFWEKGNTGPKILISRSNSSADKGQKPVHLATEKEREKEVKENKSHISDVPSGPGLYSVKDKYEKHASNPTEGRVKEQRVMDCSENVQSDVTPNQQVEYTAKRDVHTSAPEIRTSPTSWGNQQSPGTQRKGNTKYTAEYLTLPAHPQVEGRRGSDTEIVSLTRLSCQPESLFQSRITPDSERLSPLKMSPQPDTLSQSKGSPLSVKISSCVTTPQPEESSRTSPSSQPDTNLQVRESPDSEKLYQSRYSPYSDFQRGGNDLKLSPKMQRGSSEDGKRRDSEERSAQSIVSPKKQEDPVNKDRSNSPHSQRQASQCQESTAERIKQLKSFWQQERNKPVFYTGKSKGLGDGEDMHGQNLGKLNKRFTKSEYDLRTICNDSGSDMEDSDKNRPKFTIIAMNQRLDKSSPTLGANRAQFKNLRKFWGEATSNHIGSLSFDKPKSPKKKEQIDTQSPALEFKHGVEPDLYRKPTPVHGEKNSARPPAMKSSPPSQNHSKSPSDRQIGSSPGVANDNKMNLSHYIAVESGQQRDSRRSSKDSARDEKSSKSQSNQGKETRSPKTRKDSFGNLGGRGSSLRRATSMFSLKVNEEEDPPFLGQLRKTQESSPDQSQGRRQSSDRTSNRRQSSDKGAISKRSSEDSESLTPRARSFVPRDYRHYLGMTEKTSVHTPLAPATKEQELEGKPEYELDLSGPVRASTPVGSEERYGRRGSKTTQHPLWVNQSSTDTGRESSVSSTSDTWPNSRNSSNRENDNEDPSPLKRALRRAEARPKNLARSLEDITASLAPRQERRQDPIVDLRRSSDVSSVPSPSSSSFSDPGHLKNMSKSVPSFLQKEGGGRDTDSSEDCYHGGRQTGAGRTVTNLSNSSGMFSVSSLSGSVMTMYSGDFGNVEVQGNIQFSINYVQKLREFHIFVAQCCDLAAVDPKRGHSDPYVKSYLVPDKANLRKRKTSVKKKTLNPTFNEILRYRVRMEYLRTQTLILSVWHHDTFGKNSFLGEVDVDLSKWDFDHTQMTYLALKARPTFTSAPSDDRGEMRLAIRFLPQIAHSKGVGKEGPNTGEVHIWVKECKNLPLIRATIDPCVKCSVLPDTSRKSRQKTRVLRRTVEPIFNHTMVYDGIRQEDLTEACVELTVWDRDRLASNLLGGLRLGLGTGKSYGAVVDWMDSTTYEVTLWERMMASPNEWVEEVLPLRVLTSAKTALK